jgi:hypothetical protein
MNTESPTSNTPPASTRRPPTPPARRRTGTVARLPSRVREKLNLMLRDGLPYAAIIERLGEHGKCLNPDILSRWHAGGFQDWLRERAWLEEMRVRLDFASDIVSSKNVDLLNEAGLRIALAQMYNLLTTFDPASLSEKMQLQPAVYPRVLNALCKLADGALKYERHRTEQTNYENPLRDLATVANALSKP